jgi:hypothetical protein
VVAGLAAVPTLGIVSVQALIAAGLLVAVLVGALCWVVSDGGRAARLALIIRVWRGRPTALVTCENPPPGLMVRVKISRGCPQARHLASQIDHV